MRRELYCQVQLGTQGQSTSAVNESGVAKFNQKFTFKWDKMAALEFSIKCKDDETQHGLARIDLTELKNQEATWAILRGDDSRAKVQIRVLKQPYEHTPTIVAITPEVKQVEAANSKVIIERIKELVATCTHTKDGGDRSLLGLFQDADSKERYWLRKRSFLKTIKLYGIALEDGQLSFLFPRLGKS